MRTAVKLFRQFHFPRPSLVAVLMVAWLVATNHCAMGLMRSASTAKGGHAHCHGGDSKKDQPPGDVRECCKALHVGLPGAKVEAKWDASQFAVQVVALIQIFAEPTEPQPGVMVFDHGPPRALSFAESVLQRSLLGHAPPFAV